MTALSSRRTGGYDAPVRSSLGRARGVPATSARSRGGQRESKQGTQARRPALYCPARRLRRRLTLTVGPPASPPRSTAGPLSTCPLTRDTATASAFCSKIKSTLARRTRREEKEFPHSTRRALLVPSAISPAPALSVSTDAATPTPGRRRAEPHSTTLRSGATRTL